MAKNGGCGCFPSCGCFSLLFVVALLLGSCQGIYTWVRNPAPARMTCAEYAAERPSGDWLELTDCRVDLLDSVYEESRGGRVKKVYAPVRPVDAATTTPAIVVLATRDKATVAAVQKLQDLSKGLGLGGGAGTEAAPTTEPTVEIAMARHVTGLVEFGVELNDKERQQIASLGEHLDPNFVLLKEGEKPSLGASIAMSGIGLVGGGVWLLALLLYSGRNKEAEKAD